MKTRRGGFTLIELLVVISIIGLLSSVVLSALNTARAKARDAQRVSGLRELQKALALYYDKNGSYPAGNYENDSNGSTAFAATLSPLVAGGFISKIPQDPLWAVGYSATSNTYAAPTAAFINCGGITSPAYILLFQTEQTTYNIPKLFGGAYCLVP